MEVNSEVAALLIGSGGVYLKKLESQTGKIYLSAVRITPCGKYNILMSGALHEVARHALPVEEGGFTGLRLKSPIPQT